MPYDENVPSLLWFLPSCRVGEKNWLAWKETLPLKKTAHDVKNRVIFLEPDRSNLMMIRQKKGQEPAVSDGSGNETNCTEFCRAKVLFQWVQMEFVFIFIFLFF